MQKVTRRPHVPTSARYVPTVDWATKTFSEDTPKGKLHLVIRDLQAEVLDRREEQRKIEKFMKQLHGTMMNSGVYTVDMAAKLTTIKNTKPKDASTLTKPTVLGRIRLLTKSPDVISAMPVEAAAGPGPDDAAGPADATCHVPLARPPRR